MMIVISVMKALKIMLNIVTMKHRVVSVAFGMDVVCMTGGRRSVEVVSSTVDTRFSDWLLWMKVVNR